MTPLPPDVTTGGPSVVEPSAPPPGEYATPYGAEPQPPPSVSVAPGPASGQWVYTSQYGWVWMPYGSAYTYAPAGAYPDMYVYFPSYGWRWVVAPWVWGIGPRPYFGVYGWARYGWYGHGFGRWYGFRGGPVWAGRGWGHPGWYNPGHAVVRPGVVVRPAPQVVGPRPGVFVARPAPRPMLARPGPVFRPGPVAHSAPHAVGHSGGFGRR
jgi:hypothetical protein